MKQGTKVASGKKPSRKPIKKHGIKRPSRKPFDVAFAKAVMNGSAPDVRAALAGGADVNTVVETGTALCHAIVRGHSAVIDVLLAHPDIDVDETNGAFSALYVAVQQSGARKQPQYDCIRKLLDKGARANLLMHGSSALTAAIGHHPNDLQLIERLITPATLKPRLPLCDQPIHYAIEYDNGPAVALLIKHGALLKDPLLYAVRTGSASIVEALLKDGHSAAAIYGDESNSLLMEVGEKNCVRIAGLLIDAGAPLDYQNDLGATALVESVASSNLDLTRFLLERGARTDLLDDEGNHVAFALATPSTLEIAVLLRQYGVDFTLRNRAGKTALDVIQEMGGVIRGGSARKIAGRGRIANHFRSQIRSTKQELQQIARWLSTIDE